jgi:hypothetical protein
MEGSDKNEYRDRKIIVNYLTTKIHQAVTKVDEWTIVDTVVGVPMYIKI